MTERRYTRGLSFLGHLQRYTGNGCSLAEAKQHLLRRINAGEFMVDKPVALTPPVLNLELASRDRLFFVTAMERVDVSDVFTLEPVREEPLFGPPVPMSDALIERFKAKLRQPGLMYVVSSRGVETPADVLDRLDRPEPEPVETVDMKIARLAEEAGVTLNDNLVLRINWLAAKMNPEGKPDPEDILKKADHLTECVKTEPKIKKREYQEIAWPLARVIAGLPPERRGPKRSAGK